MLHRGHKGLIESFSFLVTDIDDNPEYVRGMCEALAVLLPVKDVDTDVLSEEIKKYLKDFIEKS